MPQSWEPAEPTSSGKPVACPGAAITPCTGCPAGGPPQRGPCAGHRPAGTDRLPVPGLVHEPQRVSGRPRPPRRRPARSRRPPVPRPKRPASQKPQPRPWRPAHERNSTHEQARTRHRGLLRNRPGLRPSAWPATVTTWWPWAGAWTGSKNSPQRSPASRSSPWPRTCPPTKVCAPGVEEAGLLKAVSQADLAAFGAQSPELATRYRAG